MVGLGLLYVLEIAAPFVPLLVRYPFLPLMATSVYCAVGVVLVWIHLNYLPWASPALFAPQPAPAGGAKKTTKAA